MWKDYVEQWIRSELCVNAYNKKVIGSISQNPYLPLQIVLDHPHLPWDFHALRKHPHLTDGFVKKLQKKLHRKVISLGYHPPIVRLFHGRTTYNFVEWEVHPTRIAKMSYHPFLPIALVVRMPNRGWNYHFLLRYRQWSIPQIKKLRQQRKMDWKVFSRNAFLTVEMVKHFLDAKWDWKYLAQHPSFPPQDIYEDRILFPRWKWRFVFMNPRITPPFWHKIHDGNSMHDTYHRPFILANQFQFSDTWRLHATLKIQNWYYQRRRRRVLLLKLADLCFIIRTMPVDIQRHIVLFL